MWGKTCVFCVFIGFQAGGVSLKTHTYTYVFIVLLLVCAYKAWVISPPAPPPPLPPTPPLSLPAPIPSRNYFALISHFVEERV
jgi:hypothetical protein